MKLVFSRFSSFFFRRRDVKAGVVACVAGGKL